MRSKLHLNRGYLLFPLGLLTFTSSLRTWPVQAQPSEADAQTPSLVNPINSPHPTLSGLKSQYSDPPLAQLPTLPSTDIVVPSPRDVSPQPPSQTPLEPSPPPSAPSPEEVLPSSPPAPQPPEPIPGQVPQTIRVQQFEFEGNTVISDEDLAKAAASFLNRDLTFAEVFQVRSVITEEYRKRGYITSGAIIPPQDFQTEDGVLRVQVVEGGLEAIEVRGTRRLNPDYIRSRIALGASTPLNRNQMLEALQLLQLDPLIQNLSAELSAGTQPGTSLLTVQVEEAKTFDTELSLNNNRSPAIGTLERRLQISEANLSGEGDSLVVGYSNTNGSNGFDASYTLPINPNNGTVQFSLGGTFSHVIEPPFDRIDLDADSRYAELTLRQPLLRRLDQEVAVGVTATHQSSNVTIFDVPVRLSPGADEDGSTTVTALRFFQEWTQRNNQRVFAVRSQFSLGLGLLNSTTNEDAPDSRFLSWRGQVQWVRLLAPDTLLVLRGDVQLANQALLALEQFGVGGQDTVRGYRQNVFLTDNGVLASAELRLPIARLPEKDGLLQLVPFIDVGGVWNSSDSPNPEPDPNILVSLGLGLRFRLGDYFTARFDWGIPLVDVHSSEEPSLQENGVSFSINYRIF
ncbi:MAG TPA: ShlB/FhaC/HecB family hemolysin secretion/activation protein [Coleofasciculaceae cyanobacterium]